MKYKSPKTPFAAATLALFIGAAGSVQCQELFVPGFALAEFYTDLTGTTVEDLRFDPNFPDSPADTRYVVGAESPTGYGDNYGVRISGFLTPPETGNYVFYISSDDAGEFWLSTDASPQNVVLMCNEPVWN